LVKELIDGELYIIPGKKPISCNTVQLRIIADGKKLIGQFRPDGKGKFQTAGTKTLPPSANEQVSIQCYNGPADAEHWIRFDDFRISKL
jgi:hypothetical protein